MLNGTDGVIAIPTKPQRLEATFMKTTKDISDSLEQAPQCSLHCTLCSSLMMGLHASASKQDEMHFSNAWLGGRSDALNLVMTVELWLLRTGNKTYSTRAAGAFAGCMRLTRVQRAMTASGAPFTKRVS